MYLSKWHIFEDDEEEDYFVHQKNSINKYYNPKGKFGACFMSTSCKLYKSILFQLLLQLKFKKKRGNYIRETRIFCPKRPA